MTVAKCVSPAYCGSHWQSETVSTGNTGWHTTSTVFTPSGESCTAPCEGRRAVKKTKGQSALCFPTFFINKKVRHKRKQGKKNIMLKRTLRGNE